MAEDIIYDQNDAGGDPDPLGLRRQLNATKKGSADPLGIRAKITVSGIKEKVAPSADVAFKPMTDWLDLGNAHDYNIEQSNQRVKGHLENIDESVRNLIHDHKFELSGRIKSQQLGVNPTEMASANQQAIMLGANKRQPIPVSQEEIDEFKVEMPNNPVMMRQGLARKAKDLEVKDKAASNLLKADVYRLDRQVQPEKDSKISKNIQKINEGEYDYDILYQRLVKPQGFWASLVEGIKQKNQAYGDYDVYKSGDEKKILDLINRRIKEDPDDAMPVPDGVAADGARMFGGQPLKPLIAGGVAGYFSGGTAAAAAAAAVAAPEMYKLTFGSALPHNFAALKKQNPALSDSEVLQKAVDLTNDQANADALSGAAMGAIGARTALKPSTNAVLQKSVKNALKQMGETVAIEGLGGGAVGAGTQVVKNIMAQKAGIPVDTSEGMAEQLVGGTLMTLGMVIAGKSGNLLKPSTYNKLLHGLSKLPEDEVTNELGRAQESGVLTHEEVQKFQTDIKEQKSIDGSIRGEVSESERIKIQEKIRQRDAKEKELETAHKAYHQEIKEEIKKLDESILALSRGEDKGELQQMIDKSSIKGAVRAALVDMSESELKEAFKEISQQAHDPFSVSQVFDVFGEEIVNKAVELYPVESPKNKESKVSVILPGDIKQPETITIKPKEDAISVGGPEAIMDEGPAREAGEAAGAGIPASESAPASQDEIGQPPAPPVEGSRIFAERPAGQLSFHGLQDTANEFGFEDVRSRDPKTDLQTKVNAERTANEWAANGEYQRNIDDMLGKIEQRKMVPTDEQRLILEQYIENEKQKARELPKTSSEYDRQIDKVRRLKEIGNIARSEAAAALRIPNGGSRVHPINDEVDAMAAKMEANSVDRLTDQQKAEVEAQVDKYKKANDEANAKIAELEDRVANMDSEKEFRRAKSTTKRTKKTAEERIAYRRSEIESAREALRKLRSGESGLSAVPLPGVRELIAIAPHVKNVMVDLVAQGVDNLQDVVTHLHTEFKDVLEGIREKDIHDIIAGVYNERAKSLSELQQQIKDIQDEAKYINQLESLLAGKEPKSEKAKRERNKKIKELKDKIKDFRKDDADKRIKGLEEELDRLKERKEKEPKEENKREITEREVELKKQIEEERKAIREEKSEASKFYKEELDEDVKKLLAIKKRNQKRAQEIKEKIAKGEFKKETKTSIFDREDVKKNYPNLRKEALDALAKKEDAQSEFDLALMKDQMAKRPWYQNWASFAGKIAHTTKAVMSGIDDSATFVQNGLAMMANPKIGAKVWLQHWKEAFNEKAFRRELAAIHADPDFEVMQKSGLDIVEPHNAASKQVEEAFEKNLLAGKVKINGKEYQPWKNTGGIFERAFTSMGNNFRVKLFKERMQMLRDEGKTFESHRKEYEDAARAINELTGRGKLPQGLAQAAPYITPFIWAPKMLTSTVNLLGLSDLALGAVGKGYYQNLTPLQRKFAMAQLGRGVAMGVAVMGAASLAGADVDYDPRSVTFGDVIIGDHHYNVFGRYTPVIKGIVQFAMGERLKKGVPQDLDSGKRGAKTRMGVVGGFFRGKMTPAAGAAYDLAEGKNYFTNEPFTIKDVPKALITPMSVKELIEGWENDGTMTILNRFLPAFEGLKVSDERDFQKTQEASAAPSSRVSKTKRSKPHKKN